MSLTGSASDEPPSLPESVLDDALAILIGLEPEDRDELCSVRETLAQFCSTAPGSPLAERVRTVSELLGRALEAAPDAASASLAEAVSELGHALEAGSSAEESARIVS